MTKKEAQDDLHGQRATDCRQYAPEAALLHRNVWEKMYFEMKKSGRVSRFFLLPWRGSGVGHFKLKHLVEEGEQVNIFVHTQVALIFP